MFVAHFGFGQQCHGQQSPFGRVVRGGAAKGDRLQKYVVAGRQAQQYPQMLVFGRIEHENPVSAGRNEVAQIRIGRLAAAEMDAAGDSRFEPGERSGQVVRRHRVLLLVAQADVRSWQTTY